MMPLTIIWQPDGVNGLVGPKHRMTQGKGIVGGDGRDYGLHRTDYPNSFSRSMTRSGNSADLSISVMGRKPMYCPCSFRT